MAGAFERLAQSVLNRLGQDAFLLDGAITIPCRANLEHGVQVAGAFDDAVFSRTVVTLSKSVGARQGMELHHPEGVYVLEPLLTENGHTQRFVVHPA